MVEIEHQLCYIIHRKSTHSKVDAPEKKNILLMKNASLVGQTGEAFLFLLILSLLKKVQKRYNQSTKGTVLMPPSFAQ